ncbi:hypothetical protein HYZ97_01760 [Candidatus Pacearchaeota archaeon]|nr:hypothetical protein [Candidatus Pacearchaeota archaeon]
MKRVKLLKGVQRDILLRSALKLGSLHALANRLGIPYSTIKNYSLETRLLPEDLFNRILSLSSLRKKDIHFSLLDANWGRVLGAKKGMAALEAKFPQKIEAWRAMARVNSAKRREKQIKIPSLNEDLAEFIGAYIGDGNLTKYYLKISGDHRYDLPYFTYLNSLVRRLFNLEGKITKDRRDHTLYLIFYSKKLCSFLSQTFGLKLGNKIKNNTLIPPGILRSRRLSLSCLRGLIDTDGSISRRGVQGSQFTVTFFSMNRELTYQVKSISDRYSLFTFLSRDNLTIGTNNFSNILRYFRLVGSSNLRHIVRFYERHLNQRRLYQTDVTEYYQKDLYRDINFPFKFKALSSIG